MDIRAFALRARVADTRIRVKVGVVFGVLVVLTAAVGTVATTSVRSLRGSQRAEERAYRVLSDIAAVETAVYRADGEHRAFVLTQVPARRAEAGAAMTNAQNRLASAAVAADDPEAARLHQELLSRLQARHAQLTAALATYDAHGRDAAELRVRSGEGSDLMQSAVLTIVKLRDREQALLAARDRRSERIAHVAVLASVLGTAAVAGLALLTGLVLARHLTRRIGGVARTAQAVAAGDLDVRCRDAGGDEIGALAAAVNHMADSLAASVRRLEEDAKSATFARELTTALDDTGSEAEILQVAGKARDLVAPGVPVELLLADAKRVRLGAAIVAGGDGAGSAGRGGDGAGSAGVGPQSCDPMRAASCRAFRSGRTTTFPSSRALDACPHLLERGEAGCSVVCIPLTALGGAIGVLRATGPDGRPPDGQVLDRLSTLATVTAGRLAAMRALATAERRANTDGLTGLLNRRAFAERVRALEETGRAYAVALADLDRFKDLNDTYGHDVGDRALQLFAETARRHLREEDLVARWGGEEFAFALPDLDAAAATAILERLRSELGCGAERSRLPRVTASFGVSDSAAAETLHGQLRVADAGLLQAKQGGRDRIVVATPGMLAPAVLPSAAPSRQGGHTVLAIPEQTAS